MSIAESVPQSLSGNRLITAAVPLESAFEPTTSGMLVKPEVMEELVALKATGIDAGLIDVAPTYELPTDLQLKVDEQSAAIGLLTPQEASDTLFDPTVHSAGAVWSDLSKRAIALWALKQAGNPEPHTIAPEIDPEIYSEALFAGKSALQVLRQEHPRSADLVEARYRTITTTPLVDDGFDGNSQDSRYMKFIAEHGFSYISSKDFLTGVLDSRAVDTRALAATQVALNHVLANPELFADRPLVTASLACGAAAPMFELNQIFAEQGVTVGKNILVDNDPMALASAVALARSYGMQHLADAQLRDIVGGKLTDFIEPHSVDIVDILGIVDYLPTSIKGYKAASNFIGKIVDIVRPGGIIVAGNAMLNRPHQDFFDKVWPTLQQRDPATMVDIIEDAGYDRESLIVRVPQREGVYGVYGIPVPATETPRTFREARAQRLARNVLTVVSKFNRY